MSKFKLIKKGYPLIMALASSAWSNSSGIRRVPIDSLTEYSNIRLQTSGDLILEDSLYCSNLILEKIELEKPTTENSISRFRCGYLEVTDFTFRGFEGEFAKVIYKPNGSKEVYFGKAKINKSKILSAYILVNNDTPLSHVSEKQFEEISKTAGATTIVVVAVGAIVISVLVFAAVLASSSFH